MNLRASSSKPVASLEMGKHNVLVAMNSLKFSNKAGKTTTGKPSETKREWYPDRAVLNVIA